MPCDLVLYLVCFMNYFSLEKFEMVITWYSIRWLTMKNIQTPLIFPTFCREDTNMTGEKKILCWLFLLHLYCHEYLHICFNQICSFYSLSYIEDRCKNYIKRVIWLNTEPARILKICGFFCYLNGFVIITSERHQNMLCLVLEMVIIYLDLLIN